MLFNYFQQKKNTKRGFTLIEVLVSLIIFSVVVVMAVGAVFSLVNAGEKARSLNSVMGNLNVALETMADQVRFAQNEGITYGTYTVSTGSSFLQGTAGVGACTNTDGAAEGGNALYLVPPPNSAVTSSAANGLNVQSIVYGLDNGQIVERLNYYNNASPAVEVPVTASEVHVQNLSFWVYNCDALPPAKPYVLMSVSGYAESRQSDKVSFNIQTTMTER